RSEVLRRSGRGSYFVNMSEAVRVPGTYHAALQAPERSLASLSFHLVNSDTPLGAAAKGLGTVGWRLDPPGALSAELLAADATEAVVLGARCKRAPVRVPLVPRVLPSTLGKG